MSSLKETVTKPLVISALGSFVASIALFLFISIFNPPTQFPWVRLLSVFVIVFAFLCFGFWVNSFFNYINRVLTYIHRTSIRFLAEPKITSEKELDFHRQCMQLVDSLLGNCVGAVGLKPHLLKRTNVNVCSLVLFPEDQNLIVKNLYDPNGKFPIRVGDVYRNDRYLASWAFDENHTLEVNQRKGRVGCSAIVANSLPRMLVDHRVLPFRSAISIPLKLYGNLIAALVIGADREGYLTSEDLVPSAIMGQYIASIYAHLKDYCPWHRQGWRDEKFQNQVFQHEFVFSNKDYEWTPKLQMALSLAPSPPLSIFTNRSVTSKELQGLCDYVSSSCKIKNVFLCGTFSGWNPDKTIMKKDPDDEVWRCILHLPKGEYWYRFRVMTENGDCWLFDPKLPLWLDTDYRLQSVLRVS